MSKDFVLWTMMTDHNKARNETVSFTEATGSYKVTTVSIDCISIFAEGWSIPCITMMRHANSCYYLQPSWTSWIQVKVNTLLHAPWFFGRLCSINYCPVSNFSGEFDDASKWGSSWDWALGLSFLLPHLFAFIDVSRRLYRPRQDKRWEIVSYASTCRLIWIIMDRRAGQRPLFKSKLP